VFASHPSMRTIADLMTWGPIVIDCHRSLAEAAETMARFELRHLPVVDGGRLVGILSERDVYRFELSKRRVDAEVIAVGEAMSPEPYTVTLATPVATVARAMADRRLGAAVVTRGNQIVGVFTSTDALWALAGCEDQPLTEAVAPIRP